MGWFNLKNALAVAASPFTAGASLAFLEDNNGYNALDYITGAKSAREAEKRQKQYQDETNQLNIELANTAHQREVADLKAAGLNPVLSAGGQGASTPTLGTATAQNEMPGGLMSQAGQAAQILNMAGSAKQAVSQANLNNVNAQIQPEIAKADIASKFAEAGSARAKADYTETMKDIDGALKKAQTKTAKTEGIKNLGDYEGKTNTTIKIPGVFEHSSKKSANSGRTAGQIYNML